MILLLLAQLGGSTLNLNQQPIETRQNGARLSTTRQYAIDCRTNMTCVVDGGVVLLSSSGGSGSGGSPVDAGYVVWSAAASTGSTNERVLTAGTNVTLDVATPGQVIINASGGAGSVNTASGVASFDGGSLDALTTVTAAWATGASVILCRPSGEEASVEGLQTTVTSQSAGSFVVRSEPRNGTHWGNLPFACVGN